MEICALLSLPAEIVQYILCTEILDCNDINRISLTCSHLHDISNDNELWRYKFMQKYPGLYGLYNSQDHHVWKTEYRHVTEHLQKVEEVLDDVSEENYSRKDIYIRQISNVREESFQGLQSLAESHERGYLFVVQALRTILGNNQRVINLTHQYYGRMALSNIVLEHSSKEWTRLLEQPPEGHSLEQGAVLFCQFFYPEQEPPSCYVHRKLNAITKLIIIDLRSRYPKHPLSLSENMTSSDRLPLTVTDVHDIRRALEAINLVFFVSIGFTVSEPELRKKKAKYCVHKALEEREGSNTILCIIYKLIAERLGINVELAGLTEHYMLRWQEHPQLDSEEERFTYISCRKKGKFLTQTEAQSETASLSRHFICGIFKTATMAEVFGSMAKQLVRIFDGYDYNRHAISSSNMHSLQASIELCLLMAVRDLNTLIYLSERYLELGINSTRIYTRFTEIFDSLEPDTNHPHVQQILQLLHHHRPLMNVARMNEAVASRGVSAIEAKRREDEEAHLGALKYAVGMIMKHSKYEYSCVIEGWDHRCKATNSWKRQMGIDTLSRKDNQPFYNVLVDDHSNRYAAEENLVIAPEPAEVSHPEVGKYFMEFKGTHYIPNAQCHENYPDDREFTADAVVEFYR